MIAQYTQEYIQNITTKRIASFDGLILDANDIYALRRDGKWYIDLCGNVGAQNSHGASVEISGHLMRSPLYDEFVAALAALFPFPHAVPTSSGDRANVFALKLARAKKNPPQNATIFAFQNAFHGRSPEMEALSGEPTTLLSPRANIAAIPFYSPEAPHAAFDAFRELLNRNDIIPFCFFAELFQGEGGFNYAPPEFFIPLFSLCRDRGIPVIVDEVHTCCRTGYPLLLQRFDLVEFADIATIGKATKTSAVLFKNGYDADKAKLSETNPGGADSQLFSGIRTLRSFAEEGYWGKGGKILKLETSLQYHFGQMKKRHTHLEYTVLGNMAALQLPCFTEKENAQLFVNRLLEEHCLTTTCGRGPYKVRMYFPVTINQPILYHIFNMHIENVVRSFGKLGKGE